MFTRTVLPALLALAASTIADAGGIVSGRIVDAGSGFPLPGAHVMLNGGEPGAVSDQDGRFKFTGAAPGDHEITVNLHRLHTRGRPGNRVGIAGRLPGNRAHPRGDSRRRGRRRQRAPAGPGPRPSISRSRAPTSPTWSPPIRWAGSPTPTLATPSSGFPASSSPTTRGKPASG